MARGLLGNTGALSILAGAPNGISEEDARILRGLRAGFEEAYVELLNKYEQAVYGLVYRLVGTPTDASDVVQEVFLKVFRGVDAFREQSSLKTWIYRIAVNEVHNHHRWWLRHCRREVSMDNESQDGKRPVEFATDPGRSPYDQVLDSETRRRIEQALTRIKPVFRTAVVLRDVQNLPYEEIAQILDVSLGTVKSRIVRGREALRRELSERPERGLAEAVAG
jgi:RNA polymerase sigma-70 factor (ECF subfamily)